MGSGRLEGRTALVTGGAGAIGGATVRRLVAEGASAVIADLSGERARALAGEIEAGGGTALGLEVDIADDDSVRRMVAGAVGAFGRIDILVTCAGVLAPGSVEEVALEDWERTLAVNLTGPFLASRHVIPVMVSQGSGSIIHTSSVSGLVGEPGIAAYAASKGGIVMLARQMALDYARKGIRVNVICPGWIDTSFNDPAIERSGGREALAAFVEASVPMARLGTPAEVADAIAFLASDDSRLMTGSVLVVDAGLTAQ